MAFPYNSRLGLEARRKRALERLESNLLNPPDTWNDENRAAKIELAQICISNLSDKGIRSQRVE